MDLATLVTLGLKASVVILVFGLGLEANFADAFYLFRKPWQLVRSLFAMNIIMPLCATVLALAFNFYPAVKIALVALAVSLGLLVAAGLLAIVFVPVAVEVLGRGFGTALHHMSFLAVARLVLITVLGPLLTGIVFCSVAPAFAERISQPMSLIATLLLFSCAVAVLFSSWPAIVSLIGNGAISAFVAFIIIGFLIGHLLGGPGAEERSVLALASAARHPGLPSPLPVRTFRNKSLPRPQFFCISS